MTTAAKIVNQAAQELGASSVINPLDSQSSNAMFLKLKSLINEWIVDGIDLGSSFVAPETLGDELQNDSDTDEVLALSLAVRSASLLRKVPTTSLIGQHKSLIDALLINHVKRPEQPYPATLPVGAGRRGYPLANRHFNELPRKDGQALLPDQQ